MILKFMTPRQASKDHHTLKEKIEKIEEKEMEVKIKMMEKEVEKQGV